MAELAARAGAFLLDVLEFFGVATLAVGSVFAALWMLTWLIWRLQRRRVEACAASIASALSLRPQPTPDQRMQLWRGRAGEHDLWLATCATWEGPTGMTLDITGPAFFDGAPRLTFARVGALLLVARLCDPMPDPFTLSTMRPAEANLHTGDRHFDQWFKLRGARSTAVLRVFSSAPLRDALLAIYGPDRDPSGTGIMMAANEFGLVVHWNPPRPARAAEFGQAVAQAVQRLSARRDFF